MTLFSRLRTLFGKEDKQPIHTTQPKQAPKPEPKWYSAQSHYLKVPNIPFELSERQIIFIEGKYDVEVNNFIKNNEQAISSYFESRGYEFCYIPSIVERLSDRSIMEYHAPYINEVTSVDIDSSFLLKGMTAENKEAIKPSLLYYSTYFKKEDWKDKPLFKFVNIDLSQLSNDFSEILRYIEHDISCSQPRFSLCDIPCDYDISHEASPAKVKRSLGAHMRMMHCYSLDEETLDWDSLDQETQGIISEINGLVDRLSQKGLNKHILMQLIAQPQVVSRMVITRDYRILLPDYNDMEITMTPLVKAVYLLFLRHPEGIVYKQLGDYRNELQHIYECIKGEPATKQMLKSIYDATDPFKNSINEKVARIREAFVTRFDESLASNYIVKGARGEARSVPVSWNLVEWRT